MSRKVPEDAPIGTKVVLNDGYCGWDDKRGLVLETVTVPSLMCGTWVVWVEGCSGCYALDGFDLADEVCGKSFEIKEMGSDGQVG
jgi:hypothetical protein